MNLNFVFIRENVTVNEHFLDIITLYYVDKSYKSTYILAETHIAVLGSPVDDDDTPVDDDCVECSMSLRSENNVTVDSFYVEVFLCLVGGISLVILVIQIKEIYSLIKNYKYGKLDQNLLDGSYETSIHVGGNEDWETKKLSDDRK